MKAAGRVRELLRKILYLGTGNDYGVSENQRIYLTNAYCLIAGSITLFYLPIYLGMGAFLLGATALLTILALVFSIQQNSFHHHTRAKLIALVFTCLLLFVHGLNLGRESFIQMMYVPLILGMTVIFDYERKASFGAAIAIPVLFMLSLELLDYGQSWYGPLQALSFGWIYYLNLSVTVISCLLVLGFFIRIHRGQARVLRQQAEELRESKQSLIATSHIARIGYSEVYFDSMEAKWGPELRQILGVSDAFVPTTENFFDLVHSDDRAQLRARFQKTLEQGDDFKASYRFIRPRDGHTIHIMSRGRVMYDRAGRPERMLSVVRDITEEKEKEALIRREKERAEAANLAKSRFLSNISHEIRTPLHGLLGFANLLAQGRLDETQKLQLSLIQHSGNTLMALLNDLLDLTRIEQGKMKIQEKSFEVGEMLQKTLAPYELQARDKGLAFSFVCACHLQPVINSDPIRIKQILINLVSNALKYTPEGEIRVQAEVEENPDEKGLFLLKLFVEDTGPGIPAPQQQAIFKTFTQLQNQELSPQSGLGLGLAIVRNLVELMKGSIRLKSPCKPDPEKPGSCFQVSLPVRAGHLEAQASLPQASLSRLRVPLRILVAEDNPVNQVLIQTLLQKEGYEVTLAEDGAEAVEKVQNQAFDLVLMDVQMPVMNGYEAAKAIRSKQPDLPILALSANAYEEDIQKSLMSGMQGHLSKPFRMEALNQQIAILLSDPKPEA
jgi:PAS domain S-box-containing protein